MPKRPADRGVGRLLGRVLLHATVAAGLVGGIVYAAAAGRTYLERQPAVDRLTVEIEDRPPWMSDYLAGQIAGSVPRGWVSPFDQQRLVESAERLRANPWVRAVRQVRRAYGRSAGDTVVVNCEYRAPVALVQTGGNYWLVDNDGYQLPSPFGRADLPRVTVGQDGHTALRVVTGVRRHPPGDGRRWAGDDLAAALDVAKLFHGKGYLDAITGIDVANYGGRVDRADPQVVLATRYGTQVWWGRPPLAQDFEVEVPVARKLATLRAVVRQFGRVDAGKAWLDVRFDTALLPADPPSSTEGADGPPTTPADAR